MRPRAKRKAAYPPVPNATNATRAGAPGDTSPEAIPPDLEGDALVGHVLARAGRSVGAANAARPEDGMGAYFLRADRATAAYRRARRAFVAHVPGFDTSLADAADRLLRHAKQEDARWQKLRFEQRRGQGRAASRGRAASLIAKVIGLSRFAFRRSAENTKELDRISRGKRIADLVKALDDVVALLHAHATTFDGIPKLEGAAERAAELAAQLRAQPDRLSRAVRLASRNRSLSALGLALKEIRAGAKVLYGDDRARALAPYYAASTARSRKSRTRART